MVNIMKIIVIFSKIIFIIFSLILIGVLLISITIDNHYKNVKVCRYNNEFNIENYNNISNVKTIKLLNNCDKIVVFIELEETINKDNINGIILQFVNKKTIYNNDNIIELILKNNLLNYIVIIDEEERIDIDYSY